MPNRKKKGGASIMDLMNAPMGTTLIVQRLNTADAELEAFLFSLGCYSGEPITVIRRRNSGCVVSIKDSRYSIDKNLARAIHVAQ